MTEEALARSTGHALVWRTIQHAGVHAIYFLRLVILARLLWPEDFGVMAIALTALALLLKLTDFGMIPSLVQGQEVNEKQYNVLWTVGITRAFLVTAALVVLAPAVASAFGEPRATPIIRVLAIRAVIDGAASIKMADLTRRLQFRPTAAVKLADALVNTVSSIVLAPALGVWALVIGAIAGSAASTGMSYAVAPHRPQLSYEVRAARKLIRFGFWIFATGLIAMAGGHVLRFVISRQLGAAELGLYFLAAQLAFLPAQIASEVVGAVLFPLVSRLQADVQTATTVLRSIFTTALAFLVPVCTLLITLAPGLVEHILGQRWEGTVGLIRVLAFVSAIGLMADFCVPVFNGFGKPGKVAAIEATQSVLLILLAWATVDRFGLAGAALAWIPTTIASVIVSIRLLKGFLPGILAGLGTPLILIVAACCLCALTALTTVSLLAGLPGLIGAGLFASTVTAGFLWLLDQRFSAGLGSGLAWAFPQFERLRGYRLHRQNASR